jgi:hypothetical protein
MPLIRPFGCLRKSLAISCLKTYPGKNSFLEALRGKEKDAKTWEDLKKILARYGLSQLAYRNILDYDACEFFPNDFMESLKKSYMGCLAGNLIKENVYSDIFLSLSRSAEFIVTKGAALSGLVYRDKGLRAFSDVDILIRQRDIKTVRKILTQDFSFSADVSGLKCLDFQKIFSVSGKNIKILIDVSSSPVSAQRYIRAVGWDDEAMWAESRPATIFRNKAKVMCWEDAVLYEIYHACFNHNFLGALWLMDLKYIIEKEKGEIDWNKLIYRAREYGLCSMLKVSLSVLEDCFGAVIPGFVKSELIPRSSGLSVFYAERIIAARALARTARGAKWTLPAMLDSAKKNMRIIIDIVFPSSEWLYFKYSRNTHFEIASEKSGNVKKIYSLIYLWFQHLSSLLKGKF